MTALLEHTDTASTFTGFSYEPVDASQIPTRPAQRGPGRKAAPNPHDNIMAQLAGSGEALMFRMLHPEGQAWSEADTHRLVGRQTRLLRAAAKTNERSVRVWHEVTGPEIRIYVQDRPMTTRPRKNKNAEELAGVTINQPAGFSDAE